MFKIPISSADAENTKIFAYWIRPSFPRAEEAMFAASLFSFFFPGGTEDIRLF